MRREAVDIAITTETWLTDNDRDLVWLESNGFVRDRNLISTSNRVGGRGGGIAMIFRSNITAAGITQKKLRSFERVHWMTTISTITLNILVIYHPPYSTSQKITNAMFLDDLTEFLTDWMASYRNIIICSDFNIHIDYPTDTEAQISIDTMEALGLQQHVHFQTCHADNTLDLIFTETASQFNMRTFKGSYILDHRAIVTELDIRIQHTLGKMVMFRDLKQINMEEFKSALDLGNIKNMEDLTLVNEKYEVELSRVLDHLAPEKTKFITMKENRPWFDEDVANLRQLLRIFEEIWLRIRSDNSWNPYKQIRKQYQHNLVEMKREKISMKTAECGSDSKNLFQLVNHLTGHKPEIPLLTRNSDK